MEPPPDPGRFRYWDGSVWSEHVSDAGAVSRDRWPR
ncbi:MAG: DUF2510 domain-containing protein [Microthrixaceae bacterium]|nr:DUF2510 domain-containing protein [Microthrixaceae bacterium]